jgi:hypothetical protein
MSYSLGDRFCEKLKIDCWGTLQVSKGDEQFVAAAPAARGLISKLLGVALRLSTRCLNCAVGFGTIDAAAPVRADVPIRKRKFVCNFEQGIRDGLDPPCFRIVVHA